MTVASTFAWPEPPSEIRVLGTTRRDRGAAMTTFQTRSARATRTWRFAWQAPRGWTPGTGVENWNAVPESDDAQLPQTGVFSESPIPFALERPLWRTTGNTFVFVDLYTQQSVEVSFGPDAMTVGGRSLALTNISAR
jgi:hypothetical protein